MTKFHSILLVVLSVALGYTLASRPAEASMAGVSDALSRMATALEHIELAFVGSKCPKDK